MSDRKCVAVLVGADLMFSSRIREAFSHLQSADSSLSHWTLESVRDQNGLAALSPSTRLVILDLGSKKVNVASALNTLTQPNGDVTGDALEASRRRIIGFGSHVETDALHEAEQLGCAQVYSRGEFFKDLPGVLRYEMTIAAGDCCSPQGLAEAPKRVEHSGAAALTLIVFGAIVAAIIYVLYSVLPFYYYFYELQNHFDQMVDIAPTESDTEIRHRLWYHIRRYELPVEKDDLEIVRAGSRISIALRYSEVFSIDWGDKSWIVHEFPFYAYSEGEL